MTPNNECLMEMNKLLPKMLKFGEILMTMEPEKQIHNDKVGAMKAKDANVNDTAFLCGYFSIDGKILSNITKGKSPDSLKEWTPLHYSGQQIALLSNFYYPEFVEFCTEVRQSYSLRVNRQVSIPAGGDERCSFLVEDIIFGIYPYDIVMFSIRIEFADTDLDKLLSALSRLRNCCFYDGAGLDEFISVCIDPLKRLYCVLTGCETAPDANCLVENGNKFKLFHIVESGDLSDEFLYSCATLSRYEPDSPFSASREYFEKTIAESRLNIFNNWKALMLLDTVTFCAKELSDFTKGIWTNDYFGMIYLYELYRKTYLYRQNLLFRSRRESPEVLHEQLKYFERKYTFSSISYNFLPNDVDKVIEQGLGTAKVERDVYRVIDQEVESKSAERESRSNVFLTFLTCVASLSAVWDISCMVDAMVNYEVAFHYSTVGYRAVVSVLIAIILIVLLITRYKKK